MQLFAKKPASILGFTLLELLVVISIIGILVAMGAAAFTNAQQKSRNARRRGDMKAIQNAMEQYYSQNASIYPVNCAGLSAILAPFPADPKSTQSYACAVPVARTSYCACATLENETGNSSSPNTDCSGLTGTASTYFCVKNLQ